MRRAGRVVAEVLALMESELKPGVSTGHLDELAERHIRSSGAIPSFLGYLGGGVRPGPKPFPATPASPSTARSCTASPASA